MDLPEDSELPGDEKKKGLFTKGRCCCLFLGVAVLVPAIAIPNLIEARK